MPIPEETANSNPPMRPFYRLFQHWPLPLSAGGALAALALLWLARDTPLQPAATVRVDALSAFFAFALLGGLALALAARPGATPSWRLPALVAVLLVAYATTLTLLIAAAYLLLALLTLQSRPRTGTARRLTPGAALRRALLAAPGPLAAASLLVGYGALALRGALRYDDRTAGAALDGFVFWFVLLAVAIASSDLSNDERGIFRAAWLYPLVRLYSLGPWNNGWSFATLLLGGGAALWAATAALGQPREPERRARVLLSYLGLALAGVGLGTSAGIAASCYALLTYLALLVAGGAGEPGGSGDQETRETSPSSPPRLPASLAHWLLSGAIPLTAPFVAAWMLVGAGRAGGVALLSGVAWLVALLNALTTALAIGPPWPTARRPLAVAAASSALLGLAAPLVVYALIQPVVEQLQGGLTLYGDVGVWPWVGLETIDSAHTQVTTLPSLAIAGLMLVLSALVYLVVRLRETAGDPALAPGPDRDERASDPAPRLSELIASLRDDVPWLGGAPAPPSVSEERRVDGD